MHQERKRYSILIAISLGQKLSERLFCTGRNLKLFITNSELKTIGQVTKSKEIFVVMHFVKLNAFKN